MLRPIILLLAALGGAVLAGPAAHAQGLPGRPIHLVVPYAPGGLPDVVARIVGQKAALLLWQQVVVENHPGAGGIAGTELVVKAPADGSTLLVTDGSQLTINPYLYRHLSFAPLRDLAPVSLIAAAPLFLAVAGDSPAHDLRGLLALAAQGPELSYGSPGSGSVVHLAVEALGAASGTRFLHVPFRGSAAVVQALLNHDVGFAMVSYSTVAAQASAGTVRLLAVSSPARALQAPTVPSLEELGYTDYDFEPQIGLVAPAGTPPEQLARLSDLFARAVNDPDVAKRLTGLGIRPVGSTPAEYGAVIHADDRRYARAVSLSGAHAD